MDKERYNNLDLMKVVAIIYVLVLHTGLLHCDFLEGKSAELVVGKVIQYMIRLLSEGVPIFVFVNGFLIFGKKLDMKKHIKKIVNLFLLFFIWAIIMIVVKSINVEQLTIMSTINYILNTSVGSKYTGVLWFVQNLAGLYIVLPVIKYIYDNNFRLFKYLFAVVCVFTIGIGLVSFVIDFCNYLVPSDNWKGILFFLNRYKTVGSGDYILFAMLGGIVYYYKDNIKNNRKIWIIIGLTAFLTAFALCVFYSYKFGYVYNAGFCYCCIFTPFILIGTYAFWSYYTVAKDRLIDKLIRSIAANTFGIYFIHTIIIDLCNKILKHSFYKITDRVCYFLMVFFISWMISVIFRKIPLLRKLITL